MLEAFGAASDANIFFNEIVIRLDVFVAERPVFTIAVERSRLEIPVAEAQADSSPDVGAPTGHAHAAHPVKGLVAGSGVRLLDIVDEPVVRIFVANAEFDLDGPRLANEFVGLVAILELEFGLVLGEILVGLRAAGFEKGDLQSGFRKAFAGPTPGSSGANHDHIKCLIFPLGHSLKIRSEC